MEWSRKGAKIAKEIVSRRLCAFARSGSRFLERDPEITGLDDEKEGVMVTSDWLQ